MNSTATTTLADFLAQNKTGIFAVVARRIGTKAGWRLIDVPSHNHQDIWVWFATNNKGDRRDGANVEARIDRRTGKANNNISAADYEITGSL